jgi:hypothetical protein
MPHPHEITQRLSFLERDFGMRLEREDYSPECFGNLSATYVSAVLEVQVSRDRGLYETHVRVPGSRWMYLEEAMQLIDAPISVRVGTELTDQVISLRNGLPVLASRLAAPNNSFEPKPLRGSA